MPCRLVLLLLAVSLNTLEPLASAPHTAQTPFEWRFALGASGEGLHASAAAMPSSSAPVRLPHRVFAPNSPLWYASELPIPPGSALLVEADDGAQVFVDGAKLNHYRRWFLVPNAASATRHVVVRVLNNAMQGGLQSVRVVPAADVVRDSIEVPALSAGFAPVESAGFRARMPAAGQPCRFSAWADSQGGWRTFSGLVALMTGRQAHFSVGVGDLVNDGSDPQAWRSFLAAVAPLAADTPVVPVAGNHDYDGFYNDLRAQHYLRLFRPDRASWFAWSCGDARFVALDMNTEFPIGATPSGAQHEWLMREVASAAWKDAAWRVLLVHQPPWSRSWEGYDGDAAVRAIVTPLVAVHGLDLVIAGHSHAYESLSRQVGGRTVHVLITGGGGGTLEEALKSRPSVSGTIILQHHFVDVQVSRAAVGVEAINAEGQVIDRWRIAR